MVGSYCIITYQREKVQSVESESEEAVADNIGSGRRPGLGGDTGAGRLPR
jgi:hypothetical protein